MEGGEAIWPTRARPRTDSRIVGSLGDGVEVTRPASLKILMRGAPVFLLHRHARVCLPFDSRAARLLGRLGSEGGGHKHEPGSVRTLVFHQSYGSNSAVVLKDPFSC